MVCFPLKKERRALKNHYDALLPSEKGETCSEKGHVFPLKIYFSFNTSLSPVFYKTSIHQPETTNPTQSFFLTKSQFMEKGNSSNSNNDVPNYRTATRNEYWPSFHHYPANTNEIEKGDYQALCRKCYHTFKYNIHEEGHEISLKLHYQWHINGGPEIEEKEYLERKAREHEEMRNKPKNYDWYKDYDTPPKPIHLENPRGHFLTRHEPTHYTVYQEIYEFRGDHTVSCTKCGQVLNYKDNILREHYDDHQSQERQERRVEAIETRRIIKERHEEASRKNKEEESKKLEKQLEISFRKYKKREEEKRIAATKMAEIEQKEADAAFWNEAAQMADNAGASQQQEKEDEDEEPWWDEILQYADSQNL